VHSLAFTPKTKALATLLAAAIISGCSFFWLGREQPFYAFVVLALLLFGGYQLLPEKNLYAHSLSIGFSIGTFIGGGIGLNAWAHVVV
jgi:hypothetical protein